MLSQQAYFFKKESEKESEKESQQENGEPSSGHSLPYFRAVQFRKAMFSKLHKTDSRIEKNKEVYIEKYMLRVYKAALNCMPMERCRENKRPIHTWPHPMSWPWLFSRRLKKSKYFLSPTLNFAESVWFELS